VDRALFALDRNAGSKVVAEWLAMQIYVRPAPCRVPVAESRKPKADRRSPIADRRSRRSAGFSPSGSRIV
jgi:hypothetical protein